MFVALAGGVGGAKLARGLTRVLAPDDLLIGVNTGDDFRHLGLHVSPDLDSVMYALAGLNDRERGWGLAGETWAFMAALERLGGETWFNLGDRDLATHVERTRRLAAGESLSQVTAALCAALGLRHRIVPATDDPAPTFVVTDEGRLSFQDYFVRRRCAPAIRAVDLDAAADARPAPALAAALARPDLEAVIVCPSNPFVSIDPILAVGGMRAAILGAGVPVVAVSPIVGGRAVKGPAAKMFSELGIPPSASAVARHYRGLADGFVLDRSDAALENEVAKAAPHLLAADTIMRNEAVEAELAASVLAFAARL